MGFGDLLGKVRNGRKKLEELKKKVEEKSGNTGSDKTKKKVNDILGTIDKVLDKADEVEKNGTSVSDIIDFGGDVAKDHIKDEKVKEAIGKGQGVLEDGKVDVGEIAEHGGDMIKDKVDNEVIDDVIDKGQDILEDGKIDVKEVVDSGLDVVGEHAKNEKVKTLATSVKEVLVDGKTDAGEIFGVAADVFKKEIEKAGLTDIVTKTKDFLDGITSLEELIEKGKKELRRLAEEAAKKLITEFINRFLNQGIRKELVHIKHRSARNKWGRLSMGFGLDMSLVGELSGNFTGDAVEINTQMSNTAWAEADAELDVSFTIPVIKKRIQGEVKAAVKGSLYCVADAQLILKANKKLQLNGKLKPTTVVTDYDMTVYLTIPDWIVDLWNGAAEWSFGVLDTIDGTFSRKIGKYKVFKVEIPGYNASFDMKKLKFDGGVNGNFTITKGEDVERMIKKIEQYLPW